MLETSKGVGMVGDEDAIFVKVGASNTGPGDARGVSDDFAWPD
jgi:hypothetical protein